MAAFKTPADWDKESQTLYIHKTLIRIELMKYRGKEGWCLIPTDLDQPVVEFDPTPEGRDKAFEAFATLAPPPKKKRVSKKKVTKKAAASDSSGDKDKEEKDEGDDEDDEDDDA